MMNRVVVSNCCRECFWEVTERNKNKTGGRHDGQDEKWKLKTLLKGHFFKYIVPVGRHDVFHFRDRSSMNMNLLRIVDG